MRIPLWRVLGLGLSWGLTAVCVSAQASVATAPTLSDEERALVRFIESRQAGFAAQLETAVRMDSATQNTEGVRALGAWYRTQFDELGFTTHWSELPPELKRGGHLFAERTGTRGRRLLLINHIDTVLGANGFRIEGGRGIGSGTNDTKGGNLIILEALRALNSIGALAETRMIVALTGDEESPGEPIAVARRELIEAGRRSDYALAFESAVGNTIAVGRRGFSSWELEVQGATGHSSGIFGAALGDGAIYEAARILDTFRRELRSETGLTFNPALIVGGTEAAFDADEIHATASGKDNVVAQRTLVRGDLRFGSNEQLERARSRMRAITASENLRRTGATITFKDSYPAMSPTPASVALVMELSAISQALGYAPLEPGDPNARGAGDVSFVAADLPSIDGLGSRGKGAHAPGEEVDLASLPELTKRTAVLLYRLTR